MGINRLLGSSGPSITTQKWVLTTLIAHSDTLQCAIDNLTIFFFRFRMNDASWRQPIRRRLCTNASRQSIIMHSLVVENSCLGFPLFFKKSACSIPCHLSYSILKQMIHMTEDKIKDSLIVMTFRLGH